MAKPIEPSSAGAPGDVDNLVATARDRLPSSTGPAAEATTAAAAAPSATTSVAAAAPRPRAPLFAEGAAGRAAQFTADARKAKAGLQTLHQTYQAEEARTAGLRALAAGADPAAAEALSAQGLDAEKLTAFFNDLSAAFGRLTA